jgi:phosphoribosylanthranilate isomerase
MRTRVKICGITRIEDAIAAAQAGADAIGFVFDSNSPRYVSSDQALKISRAIPPYVTTVGLFVDASPDKIEAILKRVPLDLLQFHGNETPDQCRRYHRPYIKAIPMEARVNLHEKIRLYGDASGLLLDTHAMQVAGGSGQTFDWGRVPPDLNKPLILAGGLTPENVGEAIRRVRPYAVDVSSGVELTRGVKDAGKIADFLAAVGKTS